MPLVMSVSHISCKLGLPAAHILQITLVIWCLWTSLDSPIESFEFSWCQYYLSDPLSKKVLHIVDMSDEGTGQSQCVQHCFEERNFADSGEMWSCLILGLVLSPERHDNRPQHHVGLTDQVSLYNHQICHPWLF